MSRIRRSLRGCRPQLALGILSFEEGFTLDFFGLLIALPYWLNRWHREPSEIMDRWGFYYFADGSDLVFQWGKCRKRFAMPWQWCHIKCEVLRAGGIWVKKVASYDKGEPDQRQVQEFQYRYTMKNGTVQERTAKVFTERREWRQRWLQWTSMFAKVRTSIDITFSDEVGEETGSWKGGCVGCGWDLRSGETPEQALRRMESERKF